MLASVPKVSHHYIGSDGFCSHLELAAVVREMMGQSLELGVGSYLPDHESRVGGGIHPQRKKIGVITGK